MNFRYSMINSFVECPLKFRDSYIDFTSERLESIPTLYGSAVHLALETLFQGGDPQGVFNIYWASVKDKNLEYGQFSWDYLQTVGERFIANFVRLHFKKFEDVKMEETIEMPFPIQRDVAHTMTGTFDMACQYEGKLSIVDWKTASREYHNSKIYRNPQLYIYAWLYEQKYNKLPEQIVYKVFIKKDGRIQTLIRPIDQSTVEEQMENVRSIAKNMLAIVESGQYYCNYGSCYSTDGKNCKHTQGVK